MGKILQDYLPLCVPTLLYVGILFLAVVTCFSLYKAPFRRMGRDSPVGLVASLRAGHQGIVLDILQGRQMFLHINQTGPETNPASY